MARAVKISDILITSATTHAKAFKRSVAGQIEHWAQIGKIAEENPDLPFDFIKDILIALEEAKSGLKEKYKFGEWKEK